MDCVILDSSYHADIEALILKIWTLYNEKNVHILPYQLSAMGYVMEWNGNDFLLHSI